MFIDIHTYKQRMSLTVRYAVGNYAMCSLGFAMYEHLFDMIMDVGASKAVKYS